MSIAREESVRLADLLRREHHALGDFLVALAAFDREARWVELGHASLFSFLTRELRLSAGAAQYRKTAAGLVQRYPEVERALRDGRLCLSSTIELAKVLTPENAAEVLPRFFGKSARDAAFEAASLRPVANPPGRDHVVTPVRGPAAGPVGLLPEEASPPLRTSEVPATSLPLAPAGTPGALASGDSGPEAGSPATLPARPMPPQAVPAPTSPATLQVPVPAPRPTIRPLDAERARVNMTVSRRLLEKLAAARDALSHSHPRASADEILELGLDLILERHAKRSRYIPANVKREVWMRDQGSCQWPLESGGICASTHQVEVDHIDGYARGGATIADRCRLLCRTHNDLHARGMYGDVLMNRFTRPKGGGCSEPVAVWGAFERDRRAAAP